jgi:hypothetical protein
MDNPSVIKDAKALFRECGTCSQTFAHLLNREFGYEYVDEERATDPLAGGIVNHGHQCGMLWGTILATGAEAFRRKVDVNSAVAQTITASQQIIESFLNRTKTVNCREIIGYDLSNVFGLVGYMIKTMAKGINNSQCFKMAEDWAPEAIVAGKHGLEDQHIEISETPMSCSAEVVRMMGGTEKEAVMASGFAGGLGLSGNACGALAAAIWYKSLLWCRENPGKTPPLFGNTEAKKLIANFTTETRGEMMCSNITKQKFKSINEHSHYMRNGGCEIIIDVLTRE